MTALSAVNVGVDGGQSQTRLRILPDGDIRCANGVSRLEGDPIDGVVSAVLDAWRRGPVAPVNRLVLGLTTAPHTATGQHRLADAFVTALDAREVWLAEDRVTAHAGALPKRHGVVLTVGTGVACLAVDSVTGRRHVVDGAGYLLGDDGGAFWIGRAGIAAVIRSIDGRGPATALHSHVATRYGDVTTLAPALHSSDRAVARISEFAPDVLTAAAAGDHVADRIVDHAAAELAGTVAAAVEQITGDTVAVALGGQVLEVGELLRDRLVARLPLDCPRAVPVRAAGTPLDGACALALSASPDPYGPMIYVHPKESA
jgi:N-acetylglucosamine kinase-like BadF-type ATPase